MRFVQKAFVALSLFVVPTALFAQINTATVAGAVSDPTHASIPGAQLQLENEQTGRVFSQTSNGVGQFTFAFVPVGRYTLSVRQAGFEDQKRSGIDLSAGESLNLDLQLEVGASRQDITVTSETPLLDLLSSDQHQTMTTREVNELPVAKLDWTNLLKLDNGVQKAGNGGVSLNGLPPAGFSLTVDGTNASLDAELPSLGFYQSFNVINTINPDAIQEISTTKGIAPASVAGSMGGNVNIISKGGTNQFHGTLFQVNSVAAYNARNQFLTTKPGSTFNQFGGSVGGPILHDKLFFFANFEAVRSRAFTAISDDVPTPAFVAQTLTTAPFYKPIFDVYPAPNQPYAAGAVTGRYIGAGSLVQDDSNAVGRLDWNMSSANLFTVRYTRSRPEKNQPRVIALNPRITSGHSDVYNGQWTHSAARWSAVTRFGFNRMYINRLDAGVGANLDQVQFNFNTQGAETFEKRGKTMSWEENVALTLGRHSIQFGGIVQRLATGRTDYTTSTFNYSSQADFLANIPNQVTVNFPIRPKQLRTWQYGGFVQDDFRVRSNLIFNIGLRYDYFTVPKEAHGQVFTRNPSALGPGFGAFRPPDEMYESDWLHFAPRLGFSWGVGRERKTVVRGGAGIFYNPHPIFGGPIELTNPTSQTVPTRVIYSRAQALALGLKYPADTNALLQKILASGSPIVNTTINPHFPNPYSIQWTFGIQRELGFGMVLDTAYVGNRGLHLNVVRQMNLPDRLTGIAPDPTVGQFRYYDGSDNSRYNALQVSLRKRFSKGLSFTAAYNYACNTSLSDADLMLNSNPQDNFNLRADHGPTPFDIRHSFNSSVLYEPPFARLTSNANRFVKAALGGWQVSSLVSASSGLPVNITNGRSSYPNSRPDLVGGVLVVYDNYRDTLTYLNPAAFLGVPIIAVSGASSRPGNLGRNALRAPGQWNVDASLAKNLLITERVKIQLRGDAFNAFNHTNLSGLTTDISKSSFGKLSSATSRTLQIGARVTF